MFPRLVRSLPPSDPKNRRIFFCTDSRRGLKAVPIIVLFLAACRRPITRYDRDSTAMRRERDWEREREVRVMGEREGEGDEVSLKRRESERGRERGKPTFVDGLFEGLLRFGDKEEVVEEREEGSEVRAEAIDGDALRKVVDGVHGCGGQS